MSMRNPLTPVGIESASFRFVVNGKAKGKAVQLQACTDPQSS